jgi:predicted ATP-grasp superfamily ATP-dependent carboligase
MNIFGINILIDRLCKLLDAATTPSNLNKITMVASRDRETRKVEKEAAKAEKHVKRAMKQLAKAEKHDNKAQQYEAERRL